MGAWELPGIKPVSDPLKAAGHTGDSGYSQENTEAYLAQGSDRAPSLRFSIVENQLNIILHS